METIYKDYIKNYKLLFKVDSKEDNILLKILVLSCGHYATVDKIINKYTSLKLNFGIILSFIYNKNFKNNNQVVK